MEAVSALFLLLVGAWQISQGNLTVEKFFSYLAAAFLLIDPINHTTSNYNEFKQGEASVDRVFELLAIQPTIVEKPNAIALPQAGKTTLVNLLPRFYDPHKGEILIDGINIGDVQLNSLRRQIGIVPQETILFSGTIAQNIAFGQADFDLEAVQAAAKIANADQFISSFADGYYTWVGERGVNLSGGQRQRIAIARAVLLNPRILILDEATSALDSQSEALVQEALERLMHNRTVFIIAHRLATVRGADRILVMEQGQIVESGTHDELIALERRYARFYAQQFTHPQTSL